MQVSLECERFKRKSGRTLFTTPKSFLHYLDTFKSLYMSRLAGEAVMSRFRPLRHMRVVFALIPHVEPFLMACSERFVHCRS